MRKLSTLCFLLLVVYGTTPASTVRPVYSEWEKHGQAIRYENAALLADEVSSPNSEGTNVSRTKYKSPLKAGLLSLVVPGLGQYYYGSRVKPFVFFGVEAAALVLHIKYHNDGERRTDDYEAFQRSHWSEADYLQFLEWTYGTTNEDSLHAMAVVGFSHTLPDDRNAQQFFEMTGKYNQFAWGWDDAYHEVGGVRRTLDSFSVSNPPDSLSQSIPYSQNRFVYENMRNSANNAYDKATRMLYVSLANRLISALEAYITTKNRNRSVSVGDDEFGRINIDPGLRSIHSFSDTPYLVVSYRW